MAEAQLRHQLESLQLELSQLRTQVTTGRSTVPKDLSLVSLIPKWSGTEKSVPLADFFESIESTARVGNWTETDKIQIAILKLTDSAKSFYSGNLELHSPDITWENFKVQFQKRFRDVHTDQFHFIQLQTARQKRDETPQEFADRCRSLAQKTVPKVEDPVLQKFHFDQAQRMLLAAYVSGLVGNPGQQVRFRMPKTLEEAVQIAVTVHEAEAQEKRDAAFYFTPRITCENCGKFGHSSAQCRLNFRRANSDFRAAASSQRDKPLKQQSRRTLSERNARVKSEVRCYNCSKLGHFSRDCFKKKQENQTPKKYASPEQKDFQRVRKQANVATDKTPPGNA
jgi:hypothetical protein